MLVLAKLGDILRPPSILIRFQIVEQSCRTGTRDNTSGGRCGPFPEVKFASRTKRYLIELNIYNIVDIFSLGWFRFA